MGRISHQYRHHKASDRAFVMLGGKRVYLGKYGTPKSKQRYREVLAEWQTTGRVVPTERTDDTSGLTIRRASTR